MKTLVLSSFTALSLVLSACGGESKKTDNRSSGSESGDESSDLTFEGPGGSFALALPELPKEISPIVANVRISLVDGASGKLAQQQMGIYRVGAKFLFEKLKPTAYVVEVVLLDEKQNPVMKGISEVKVSANQEARTAVQLKPIQDGSGSLIVVIDPIDKPEPQPEPQPEPKPEPKPQPPQPDPIPRKCGVNSYSVGASCGKPNQFSGASFECYDGAAFKVALGNQCMTSEELMKTYSAKCDNHCNK